MNKTPILLIVTGLMGATLLGADELSVSELQITDLVDPDYHFTLAVAASDGGGNNKTTSIASQATDPSAPLIQLQFQDRFASKSHHADGSSNQFVIQPVIPIKAMGFLPRSILRLTVPIVSTPDLDVGIDGTDGLGDSDWLYVLAFDQSWGSIGIGGAGAFPTATDSRLGARKWTAGPAAFLIYTKIPKTQLGVLVFNTWSFAGAGDADVNSFSLQPILTRHFNDGWYGGMGDEAWSVNWEKSSDQVYLPLSGRVGRVFAMGKQHVNVFGQGFYNVGDDVAGFAEWGFKLNFTFLFPE